MVSLLNKLEDSQEIVVFYLHRNAAKAFCVSLRVERIVNAAYVCRNSPRGMAREVSSDARLQCLALTYGSLKRVRPCSAISYDLHAYGQSSG